MDTPTNPAPSAPEPTGGASGKTIGIISAIILVVLILGVGLMFGRNDDAPTDETADIVAEEEVGLQQQDIELPQDLPVIGEAQEEPGSDATQGAVKEFTVSGTNFAFDPAEIRVQQGDTVRITLVNDSAMPHDWKLDEFNAATAIIQGGQQDTIEFVADEAGEFEYYCSVGQHRELGMVGTLIVE